MSLLLLDDAGQRGFLRRRAPQHGLVWDFIDEQDRPWCFAGYTMHLILPVMQRADVTPVLREAIGYGANTIVTVGTHLSAWKQDHGYYLNPLADPAAYQDLLAALFTRCAALGLRVAHAVLADCQRVSVTDQRRIWALSAEVAAGRWNVLLRLGNESASNGWTPTNFSQPSLGGVLCSTGSVGIGKTPHQQTWDFSEWEPRRDLRTLHKAMDDSGAGIQEQYVGYLDHTGVQRGPWRCPIVAIEPALFAQTTPDHVGDARWTDPQLALQLGLQIGPNCAGGAFGSSRGLEAQPNEPRAAECARQFFRGLRASFLR